MCIRDRAEQGVAHVIVDAVANEDLRTIAEAARDMILVTGGSAVAMPLPDLWLASGLLSPATAQQTSQRIQGPAIVLSGSCSSMTNRQVAAFLEAQHPSFRLDPLDLAANGNGAALDWLAAQDPERTPIIYATAEPDIVRAAQDRLGRDRAGELVEAALAACAIAARNLGRRKFVIAGGETSGAVGKALELDRLDIGPEIAPGVPWCFATSKGEAIAITLKSGNFGTETFFEDALGMLARD